MAWQRICTAYNALSVQFRTVDQLKSKYDNLKTKARKVVAENKTYINGTGGGGPNADKFDTVIELILKIINIKTVVGFQNPFDCDNVSIVIMKQCSVICYLRTIAISTLCKFD